MPLYAKRFFAAFILLVAAANSGLAEVRLLMVEQGGCSWCERWDAEIGPIYPKTSEGRIAPLLRVDIDSKDLDFYDLESKPYFTPTFILVDDMKEVARMEGYAGDQFFWSLVDRMITALPADKQKDTGS